MNNGIKNVCVVGGGAAGMMAAGTALLYGADVTIFDVHADDLQTAILPACSSVGAPITLPGIPLIKHDAAP